MIITDPWLGKRVVAKGYQHIIRDQYLALTEMQKARDTAHIRDDIAVYKYILDSSDPEKFAKDYFETRTSLALVDQSKLERGGLPKKRFVAIHLGWSISFEETE